MQIFRTLGLVITHLLLYQRKSSQHLPVQISYLYIREKEVVLMELTIPHNSLEAINSAQRRKSKENYQLVLSEMDKQGLKASFVTLEVGGLGHSLLQTHTEFRCVFPTLSKKTVRQTV